MSPNVSFIGLESTGALKPKIALMNANRINVDIRTVAMILTSSQYLSINIEGLMMTIIGYSVPNNAARRVIGISVARHSLNSTLRPVGIVVFVHGLSAGVDLLLVVDPQPTVATGEGAALTGVRSVAVAPGAADNVGALVDVGDVAATADGVHIGDGAQVVDGQCVHVHLLAQGLDGYCQNSACLPC